VSTWLTVICVIIAPWISILLDPAVRQGDLIPVLYVGLSVQGLGFAKRKMGNLDCDGWNASGSCDSADDRKNH